MRDLGIALFRGLGDAVAEHDQGVALDLGCRPQRPHGHQPVLSGIGGRQRTAVLLGEVEVDGERLVQHQPVIFDRRNMAVGIDPQELGRLGVQHALGGLGPCQAVELHHRHVLEVDSKFGREPDVAQSARAIDAVDRQHGGSPRG